MLDLVAGLVEDQGLQVVPAHQTQYLLRYREHIDLYLVAEIKGLAADGWCSSHFFCKRHISDRRVLDIKIVANKRAVAADDRGLVANDRADRSRNKPVPVQVAAAEKIAASSHADRQAVSMRIRLRDQVCT